MSWMTPWAVGGGAEHQVEVARRQTFIASGGSEGIGQPGDLKVSPLAVPGTKVRVAPGGAVLRSRYPGASGQSYAIHNSTQHEVSIRATGSGGGRTDLVVARVVDPQYEGQPPSNPNTFDYARTAVIEGVPADTESAAGLNLSYPAIALARVTLPASTGTVQASHITDLRQVAQPRKERHLIAYALTASDPVPLRLTSTTGAAWPRIEDIGNTQQWYLTVPDWARRVRLVCQWAGVRFDATGSANCYGRVWGRLGAADDPAGIDTQETQWDNADRSGIYRDVLVSADDRAVPVGLRGRRIPVYLRGRVIGGSGNARPTLDAVSAVTMDVEFYEAAV